MLPSNKKLVIESFTNKTAHYPIATCEVTGLVGTIEAPILPHLRGQAYEFLHPLSFPDNSLKIGKLAYSELIPLPSQTLAGAILSILAFYKLRCDKLSALEANLILSELPSLELANALRFLSSLSAYTARRIPCLSLTEGQGQALKNWLFSSSASLMVNQTDKTDYYEEQKKSNKTGGKNNIIDSSVDSSLRAQAKEYISILIEDGIISPKVSHLFKSSVKGHQLAFMGQQLRKSLIAYLQKYETNKTAISLIEVYKQAENHMTTQEKIISSELDSGFASDSFSHTNVPSKKLSLSEIIAARKEQLAREEERKQQAAIREISSLMIEAAQELEEEQQKEVEETEENEIEQEVEELAFEEIISPTISELFDPIEEEQENTEEIKKRRKDETDAIFSAIYDKHKKYQNEESGED